ncbi:YihY/virulence factor BrkB family protein [Sulfurihydrogenibium azorense]|uniref:YihY/virulence factor BrkB family protein n=1 Tax=Sulfurihydrogenibium azorense TaxID=309806 RepID=UPI00391C4FEC
MKKVLNGIFIPFFISLILAIKDYFNKNYSYHSSSLAFYFFLSIFPMFIFVFSILSFIAFLKISDIYYIVYNLFPNIAEKFLENVLKFYNTNLSTNLSLISILLSLYFGKDLFIAIQMAFHYVWELEYTTDRKKMIVSILALPFIAIIFTVFYLFMILLKFIDEVKNYLENFDVIFLKWLTNLINFLAENVDTILNLLNISEIITFFVVIYLLFYFFTPVNVERKKLILVVLFVSFCLFMMRVLFESVIINFLSKNPLFLTVGSIFAFLVWVKLSFDIILIGQRIVYHYSKHSEGKSPSE